jgi:uncharacterized protein YecT (DUF1311 family)
LAEARRVRAPALFLALLAGLAAPARADPTLECPGGSQVEIGDCLARTEAQVDQALATALGFARQTAEELDQATQRSVAVPALEGSQAAWMAWRDAQCDYVGATFGGGSGTGQAIRACRIELGRARMDQLMRRL